MVNQCTKFEVSSLSRSRDFLWGEGGAGLKFKMGHEEQK